MDFDNLIVSLLLHERYNNSKYTVKTMTFFLTGEIDIESNNMARSV